jgi:RNA polymerase sigma-70 factor (ECF subfamily)
MTSTAPSSARPAANAELSRWFAELYESSGARQFGFGHEAFEAILAEIGDKYGRNQDPEFFRGLRVEELALARGCAAGNEYAWEVFLTRYRARLYEIALGITRDDVRGRELADSLYADLFGTTTREGQRVSKLNYYTGRGSLEGWLRSVLAQEYVNRYRKQSRLVSLEEQEETGAQFEAPKQEENSPGDARVVAAVDDALSAIGNEERLILVAYFLDGRKLADIGRMLGMHESSVSRKLAKIAKQLRKQIVHNLQRRGMSRRQVEEALEGDVRDLAVDVRARLGAEREQKATGP